MAKSAKELRAEIEAMRAMIDTGSIPEDEEPKPRKKSKRYTKTVPVRYIGGQRFQGSKNECEECSVFFYPRPQERKPINSKHAYAGRLCGENCASIVLEIAREMLAEKYAQSELPLALRLQQATEDDRPAPTFDPPAGPVRVEAMSLPAPEPSKPLTAAEKIRLKLSKKS